MMHKENTVFKKREQKNIVFDMFMLPLKKHAIWKPYVISFLGNEERLNPLSTQRKICSAYLYFYSRRPTSFSICVRQKERKVLC